jgi:hypothetical protein
MIWRIDILFSVSELKTRKSIEQDKKVCPSKSYLYFNNYYKGVEKKSDSDDPIETLINE